MLSVAIISVISVLILGIGKISDELELSETNGLRVESISYISSIWHVLEKLPQHRGMGNAWLNGEKELSAKLSGLEEDIEKLFSNLQQLDVVLHHTE